MSNMTLNIDGQTVEARPGDTVLDAAQRAGIEIPTLCAHPDLEPSGACRLCVVEIDGLRGLPTSCTTPAADGMVVRTRTPRVMDLRREVLKLLLSGHTSPCLTCLHKELCDTYRPNPEKAGRVTRCGNCSAKAVCEVRKLSEEYGITDLDLPVAYPARPLERQDPFMDRDYSLCVLCGRCVRVCRKLHGRSAIDFVQRGKDTRIGTAFGHAHTDTACRFCGACIDICPNGALSDRFARWRGAPDHTAETTCSLCPVGCRLRLRIKNGELVSTGMTAFNPESRICAAGRFVYPQVLAATNRLRHHTVRLADGPTQVDYEAALDFVADALGRYRGGDFALLAHGAASREEHYLLRRFCEDVMQSRAFHVLPPHAAAAAAAADTALDVTAKAVLATGNFAGTAPQAAFKAVLDILPPDPATTVDALLAVADLAETDGTFLAAGGDVRPLTAAASAPEGLRPAWQVVCDLARRMGASGFDFADTAAVRAEMDRQAPETPAEAPPMPDPSPLDDVSALPRHYRGHDLTDVACALGTVLKTTPAPDTAPDTPAAAPGDGRFEILDKAELAPNIHMLTIRAPEIAAACRPGHFVIAMANEKSERIPYTPADWDPETGTVTINVLEAGRSSREVTRLGVGDRVAHLAGPLGTPIEIKRYGTVLCGGGCYGVGGMLPLARALKDAGNDVIVVEEASSAYLLYWEERLRGLCDTFRVATKDGTRGTKGGIQEVVDELVAEGLSIDQAFISGCTFMMMLVCETTQRHKIPTLTAMNPIMLDGTGMCGACRVSVGDETKFACVDGPYLDGHRIDWKALMQRQAAYRLEEIQALPQDAGTHEHAASHTHRCRTI